MTTGEWVEVIGIGTGVVQKIRFDDGGVRPIYTIKLDDPELTPDGLFYARREELKWRGYATSR